MKSILNLKSVRKELPFDTNTRTTVFHSLRYIVGETPRYKIDFDVFLKTKGKNLQRPYVWSLFQKQELIISILKGINIPDIAAVYYQDDTGDKKNSVYKIIDGKQRVSTIISFYNGEFPIVWDGKEYFFNDLDKDAKYEIEHMSIYGTVAYEYPDKRISDDDLIAWFELINFAGTPQDINHLKDLKS